MNNMLVTSFNNKDMLATDKTCSPWPSLAEKVHNIQAMLDKRCPLFIKNKTVVIYWNETCLLKDKDYVNRMFVRTAISMAYKIKNMQAVL